MVKVLLKHFIYEKCINVIFDQMIVNFSDSNRERMEFYLKRASKLRKSLLRSISYNEMHQDPTAFNQFTLKIPTRYIHQP